MPDNQTRIPCGEYPILANYSSKAWSEWKCVGRIRINRIEDILILPPDVRNTTGYPVEVESTKLQFGSPKIELRQTTGNRKVFTFFNVEQDTSPQSWILQTSSWDGDHRPIMMYPELLAAITWLKDNFKKNI